MKSDIFGNLREWGQVLELLDNLKKSKELDENQSGLARILRYRKNWRLLERVLEYGKEIRQPADEFLSAVSNIVTDQNIYLDARILAVNALGYLIPRRRKNCQDDQKFNETLVVGKMMDILNSPGPPIFQGAISKSLKIIRGKR